MVNDAAPVEEEKVQVVGKMSAADAYLASGSVKVDLVPVATLEDARN